jgi:hypothetical protein
VGDTTSKNERAEKVMGRRLRPEDEERGVIPFDFPCELGYWCPTCRIDWCETLQWSEYAGFLWCETCDFDWPSALCVRVDAQPDPERPWMHLGREAAVNVYLSTVERVLAHKEAQSG